MSENSFDHSSSVHLRDLSKLVFAFSTEEKNQSPFQVNDNPQDSNLHACFGVSNTGIDTKKDEAITLQTSTRDDYPALDQNQRDLILEQSFDGNVEEVDMEEELSSGSCAETDPDETQTETKNSLHLITELCDRLLSRDGKRFEDVPRTGNTVNTPYTSERLNYSSTHETIAHCISTICSSDDGFYQPSSLYSCAMNNTYKECPDSINEQNGAATLCIANTRYSTYNNQQNHVAKRLQSFETSELSCAISNIQQMLSQISPPAHSVTGSLSQISDHNGQLPSDEIIQCISIKEPFTGANVLATSSPQASSSSATATNQNSPGKYSELLAVIEELGKDIRPTYAGSKNAAERLKKGIMHARVLVRECLVETDKCARQ